MRAHMPNPDEALAAWEWRGPVRAIPATTGLINATWLVEGDAGTEGVLQTLNTRIFDPALHENIDAVTRHVAGKGLRTPLLVPPRAGGLAHAGADGTVWRVLTPVGDRTV